MSTQQNTTQQKYQKGKIYCLRSNDTDLIYIGSTIQTLSARKSGHVAAYKRYKNGNYNYMSSFELVKLNNFYIELVENYPCNSKCELDRREGVITRQYKSDGRNVCNKNIAGRDKKQYYNDNKAKILEYKKQYHNKNKAKILEYKKEYYNKNKSKFKQYRIDNKVKLKEYDKQYYNKNKQKITCECGSVVGKKSYKRHLTSIKHKNYVDNQKSLLLL